MVLTMGRWEVGIMNFEAQSIGYQVGASGRESPLQINPLGTLYLVLGTKKSNGIESLPECKHLEAWYMVLGK
jgi:hypothetical protein